MKRLRKFWSLDSRKAVPAAPENSGQAVPALPAVPDGFTAMTTLNPDDVAVVGYPKSGNTWVQNLLASAVYGLDLDLSPDSLVQQLVPDSHQKPFYKRHLSPLFFKSHALPKPEYRRVVYLLRDGRDAMVSYRHYLEALEGHPLDFLDLVTSGKGLFPCKWHEHVQQWLANPYHAEMVIVRYEELKGDALQQLRRILDFAGVQRALPVLQRATEKASFAAMQQREKRLGWEGAQWPKDKLFIRRGAIGSFCDEMPRPVLEAFMREAGPLLRELGYVKKEVF
jgi:hypothetical protein